MQDAPLFEPGLVRDYRTTRKITWGIGRKGSPWTLTIGAGREFESSIPRGLRWALSPHDPRFLLAALVHDDLLEAGFRPYFAAGEWYDAALSCGAPRGLALAAALGVTVVTVARRKEKRPAGRSGRAYR